MWEKASADSNDFVWKVRRELHTKILEDIAIPDIDILKCNEKVQELLQIKVNVIQDELHIVRHEYDDLPQVKAMKKQKEAVKPTQKSTPKLRKDGQAKQSGRPRKNNADDQEKLLVAMAMYSKFTRNPNSKSCSSCFKNNVTNGMRL